MAITASTLITTLIISGSAAHPVTPETPQRGTGILSFTPGVKIPGLKYTPKKPPVTPYDVTVVTKEYGISDMPNNPRSPGFGLAVINALMGAQMYHSNSVYSDLSKVPASNIHSTVNSLGGKTTTYLVPTKTLPILSPLAKIPHPPLNGILKPLVDSAYSRPGAKSEKKSNHNNPKSSGSATKHAKKGKK